MAKPGHLKGKSIVPLLDDPSKTVRDAAFTVTRARGKIPRGLKGPKPLGRTIRTDRYRYTEWGEDGEFGVELYDYQSDPGEYTNLAKRRGNKVLVNLMRAKLLATRAFTR